MFSSGAKLEIPVTLPPGRARLATKPAPTGSPEVVITMGMVAGRFLRRQRVAVPMSHDQINLETNQVRRKLGQALSFPVRKSVLDGDILSLNPSKFAQLLPERFQQDGTPRSSACIQETYAEDFPCLLRLGRQSREQGAGSIEQGESILLSSEFG